MELLQLKYFKKVAEIGKICDAADELFVSAPALSAAISRLEKDLGMPLFDRTSNKITLNQQGQIFLQGVNQIFLTIENTKETMEQSLLQRRTRQLSLCVISSTQWVDLIAMYSQSCPEVTLSCLDLKKTDLEVGGLPTQHNFLLADQNDVPPAIAAELERFPLLEDHPVIMVNALHPLAQKKAVDVRELADETLFVPMAGYSVHNYLLEIFREAGMALPAGNAYSHLAAQQIVAKGLGVGFSSMNTVRISAPGLCYIPISNGHRPWELCLYWRKDRPLTADESSFMEYVKEYCAQKSGQHNIDIKQD